MIFISVMLLLGLGIVMTYSSSAMYAEHVYHTPQYFLIRQALYALAGIGVYYATSALPVVFWKRYARAIIILAIFFLMMVFLPVLGRSGGGAQRWIRLGPVNFQPAEFAKLAVCVYLSDYLTRKNKSIRKGSILVFLPPIVLVGSVCALTLIQPDMGSTAFIFLTAALMFFLAGIKIRYIAAAAGLVLPLFYFLVMRVPYRVSRVTAYLNPWEDPQGSGFQIIQSLLAFGIGGPKGEGLGHGIQKLFYLPSSYNDFIFAIIGEELGLAGVLFVLGLYVVIFVAGIQMAERAPYDYEKLLIISLTLMIVLQAIIHMLVTTGLIPTKGLSLPFVSFGGTSLIFNMMAMGFLMAIDREIQAGGASARRYA